MEMLFHFDYNRPGPKDDLRVKDMLIMSRVVLEDELRPDTNAPVTYQPG